MNTLKNKSGRRHFLASISAAIVGSAALGSCINRSHTENKSFSEEVLNQPSGNKIAENREMPRDLVLKLLDQKVDQYMHLSYNCAQSSFLALKEQFGLEGDDVLKALTPLTGIAERGETCGAITGSLMVFGLLYGRGKSQLGDWDTYRKSLVPSGKFCERFEKKYGSTMCCKIQQKKFGRCFHLTQQAELRKFQEAGATDVCSSVVRDAVGMAAEIILGPQKTA
ncbi:MAG: C_GCAxxG_C_C family protein [Bacteroidales bacterium]|nr:C_GCAxxG_C_C family protein [Bacteroidales bacterium]